MGHSCCLQLLLVLLSPSDWPHQLCNLAHIKEYAKLFFISEPSNYCCCCCCCCQNNNNHHHVIIVIIIIWTQNTGVRMTHTYSTVGKLKDSTKLQINSENFIPVNFWTGCLILIYNNISSYISILNISLFPTNMAMCKHLQ